MVQRGVTGAVPSGSVGPKIATTGNPTEEATCIAPESLPTKRWHCDRSAGRSAIAVFPVRSIGALCIAAVMAEETGVSATVPNKIIWASDSATKRFATSAKRSGGQHFAEPYEAPAPMATRNLPGCAPEESNRSAAERLLSSGAQ